MSNTQLELSFADFRMLNREPGSPKFQLLDTSRLDVSNYPFKFNTILSRKNLAGLQVRPSALLVLLFSTIRHQHALAKEVNKVAIRMQEHEAASDLLRRQPELLTRVVCGDSVSEIIYIYIYGSVN